MSSAVHTGLGGGAQRINNSPLDCLEHNDRITYIPCCKIRRGMTTNKQRRIGFPTSANVGGLSSILAPMFYNGEVYDFIGIDKR